jgi:hypothetical protein
MDFRSRANTTKELDFDHMMRRAHKGGMRIGKTPKKKKQKKHKIAFDVFNAKENVTHMYRKAIQGISPYSYPYLN